MREPSNYEALRSFAICLVYYVVSSVTNQMSPLCPNSLTVDFVNVISTSPLTHNLCFTKNCDETIQGFKKSR